MDTAVTQVTAALPAIGAGEATAVLEAAVPITVKGPARFLEELAAHMAAHPDALTSGSSLCPPVLLRLAHVLHEAGHPVVRPGCARCGTIRTDLRQLREEGRICSSCDARSRKDGTCGRCGATGVQIMARRPEGGICHRCYRRDPLVVEECRGCGRVRNPAVRLPDGGALCHRCWERPQHTCVSCGKTAPAALLAGEGAYCHLCYDRQWRPLRQCGKCGRMAKIRRNARDGHPDLCDRCYRGPEQPCSRCGRVRPCVRVTVDEPICHTCYARDERPRMTCARCQRDKPVNAFWPIGPVCMVCYTAIVRAPAECAGCHQSHPLIGRDATGAGLCGPCAGADIDFTCRQCGRSGYPYGHGRCAYCVLADKVTELLTGPDGTVAPELQPLAAAFTQVHLPFTAIQWTRQSPTARLLAHLVAQQRPITHDLLDEIPPGHGPHYLRQALVQTGILPQRDEDLERVPAWLEHHLAGKPAGHARLIRPFLHWSLLRRARSRARRRQFPASIRPPAAPQGPDRSRVSGLDRPAGIHPGRALPGRRRPLARPGTDPAPLRRQLLPQLDRRPRPQPPPHRPAHPEPGTGGLPRRRPAMAAPPALPHRRHPAHRRPRRRGPRPAVRPPAPADPPPYRQPDHREER
jgi:hypothetical protein